VRWLSASFAGPAARSPAASGPQAERLLYREGCALQLYASRGVD